MGAYSKKYRVQSKKYWKINIKSYHALAKNIKFSAINELNGYWIFWKFIVCQNHNRIPHTLLSE